MLAGIDRFITLGPLGTALAEPGLPRVLLIDEIDKSDIDFPDELLHELEEFSFALPELQLHGKRQAWVRPGDGSYASSTSADREAGDARAGYIQVSDGMVSGGTPPIVVITSNRERELSPAFHRRCINFQMAPLSREQKARIIATSFGYSHQPLGEDEIRTELQRLEAIHAQTPPSRLLDWFLLYKDGVSSGGEHSIFD